MPFFLMRKHSLDEGNVDVEKQKIERASTLLSYEISLELGFSIHENSLNIK